MLAGHPGFSLTGRDVHETLSPVTHTSRFQTTGYRKQVWECMPSSIEQQRWSRKPMIAYERLMLTGLFE
eukprot:scaffold905_cov160-Amphora_coffeaeformis.AAC.5